MEPDILAIFSKSFHNLDELLLYYIDNLSRNNDNNSNVPVCNVHLFIFSFIFCLYFEIVTFSFAAIDYKFSCTFSLCFEIVA